MVKRARNNNSNSNNDKTLKSRAREVVLPPLVIGRGMSCGYAGIPRYLKRAKDRFDNLGYVSAFFNYNIHTEKYGIVKNIDKIKNTLNNPNTNSRISSTPNVHFFMVGMTNRDGVGHAVSVLVDPNQKKIWAFDPHGENSSNSEWGVALRRKIIPILQGMWGGGFRVRYYNGRNLQADNTRGTCTTFYVTFMDMIPHLLSGQGNINQVAGFIYKNITAIRQFYLNFAPPNVGRIVTRNVTQTVGSQRRSRPTSMNINS